MKSQIKIKLEIKFKVLFTDSRIIENANSENILYSKITKHQNDSKLPLTLESGSLQNFIELLK